MELLVNPNGNRGGRSNSNPNNAECLSTIGILASNAGAGPTEARIVRSRPAIDDRSDVAND